MSRRAADWRSGRRASCGRILMPGDAPLAFRRAGGQEDPPYGVEAARGKRGGRGRV